MALLCHRGHSSTSCAVWASVTLAFLGEAVRLEPQMLHDELVNTHLWTLVDGAGLVEKPTHPGYLSEEIYRHVDSNQPLIAIVDVYELLGESNGKSFVVLGEGLLPGLSFPTNTTYKADLQCVWALSRPTQVEVQLMRQKDGSIMYTDARKVFSDNGDVYRTHYIICKSGRENDSLQGLQQTNGSILWSMPSDRVSNLVESRSVAHRKGLSVCLAPIYGNDVRWFIEWMEYHKQLGVSHVHIPMNDRMSQGSLLWKVAKYYASQGFATLSDWSDEATSFITKYAYERGKWPAWSSCYLRNRGIAEWLAFIDLDEILALPNFGLEQGLAKLNEHAHEGGKLGFALQSVTVTSVLDHAVLPFNTSKKLLLEEFQDVEANCTKPFNCGEFHNGRQKYILHTADPHAPLVLPWTHGVSRDYTYARTLMDQVPDSSFHVRHYQAHWHKNKEGTALTQAGKRRKFSPIPQESVMAIKRSFKQDGVLMELYKSPAEGTHVWGHPIRGQTLERYQCTDSVRSAQSDRWITRNVEWWSHSACPAQYWIDALHGVFKSQGKRNLRFMDVGCNKGYTSAKFLNAFSPSGSVTPVNLHKAIDRAQKVNKQNVKANCGKCGDCKEASANLVDSFDKVTVHCFEPSPASMALLRAAHDYLNFTESQEWVLHEAGMSKEPGTLWWNASCSQVGIETCKIVPPGTADAIAIKTYTVDSFAMDTENYAFDILKIDAEGHDPAVLWGAEVVLSAGQTPVVTFEYNPGIGGFWKEVGLIDVTGKLDGFGYDCYYESNQRDHNDTFLSNATTPSLYLITGGCMSQHTTHGGGFRGWSNVVCALRADFDVANLFRHYATFL